MILRRSFSTAESNGLVSASVRRGSLLLKSPDSFGIVSAVADCTLQHGNNMTGADLHVEKGKQGRSHTFLCRFSWEPIQSGDTGGGAAAPPYDLNSFELQVSEIVSKFRAKASLLHPGGRHVLFDGFRKQAKGSEDSRTSKYVMRETGPARMGIFLSGREHCVNELLVRCQDGDLPVTIPFVISNHDRTDATSSLHRTLSRLNIPYHYIPRRDRSHKSMEAEIQEVCSNYSTDFLVLARYMQILTADFLRWYGADRPIINIHHGLLPSFKGANPYGQAYDAGVKLIGATAHFVTEDLDEGPIIEQLVDRVSHRDVPRLIRIKSESLEANALHAAVRHFAGNRISVVRGRTIVFT